eukprot:5383342-Prymnesium_polylepis.1
MVREGCVQLGSRSPRATWGRATCMKSLGSSTWLCHILPSDERRAPTAQRTQPTTPIRLPLCAPNSEGRVSTGKATPQIPLLVGYRFVTMPLV